MNRWAIVFFTIFLFSAGQWSICQEIGIIEDFALTDNRAKVLDQLVPGTQDYYYYTALYLQSIGELEKVDGVLKKWIKDHKETGLVKLIQNRQALLKFSSNPDATYEFLQKRLKLDFNHQREVPTTERDLATNLDEELIKIETLTRIALARYRDLTGFSDTGLEYLNTDKLSRGERHHLLQRLKYPDYPNVVSLIVEHLKDPGRNHSFGDFTIHRNLTILQLEECLERYPRLLNETRFVYAYLSKLHPSNDVNWRSNPAEYRAYLQRLYKFTKRLNPVYNSLKACVLFRILELNHNEGKHDRDLFFEYLKIPRGNFYVNAKLLPAARDKQNHIAKLNANFEKQIRLKPVVNDFDLVYEYLNRFLIDAENYDAYAPYIKDGLLRSYFATVKLLNGIGDKEKWAAKLSQSEFKRLKDRVDLDFAVTNKEFYNDDDVVAMDLFVKNVKSLIVKVYKVNELNYYRKNKREIDTDISLDGLVPNSEYSFTYDEDPVRRSRRTYNFEELTKNGIYVVDFIGGGKSSRALIRRGRLSVIAKTTVGGQLFHVFDDSNQPVKQAEMWIEGNQYSSDENGVIAVPFSNRPGKRLAIISSGDFSSLQTIEQQKESYSLTAGIYVDRESLLFNQEAQVVIRPSLQVSGTPTSVKLLKDATLSITSVNQQGISSTRLISDLKLEDDAETVCDFIVPPRLKSISFSLQCKIENISQNREESLSNGQSYSINSIDTSDEIQDVHLMPTDSGYKLEVRGRSGEIRREQAARIELKHRDFKDPVLVDLESDKNGQINLGKLEGVELISVSIAGGSKRKWDIDQHGSVIVGKVNAAYRSPVMIAAPTHLTSIERERISLFEKRNGQFVADHFDKIKLENRMVVLSGLASGDYTLRFKNTNQLVDISVADGEVQDGVVLGKHRRTELRNLTPLVIDDLKRLGGKISVTVGNSNELTRVHVFASRYQPRFSAMEVFGSIRDIQPWQQTVSIRKSAYLAGRKLSDEYQYILNRRYEKKFPGNMLTRPSVLVNPWAIRETQNNVENLEGGDKFGNAGTDQDSLARRQQSARASGVTTGDFANLDFLTNPSKLIANLKPDKNGELEIDLDDVKNCQYLRIVAVDPVSTIQRELSLEPVAVDLRDLRLANGLDPRSHFAQSKQIEILNAGEILTIEDLVSGRFHYFDDIGDVFRLFQALNPKTKLNDFQFLLSWSERTQEEKQSLYSKFACHELNFYLFKKDRSFFDKVVRPHISYKSEAGLIDQFLNRKPLQKFVEQQWKFTNLNVFERILLAQQLESHSSNIIRHIDDLYYLKPVKPEYFDSLYDQSIRTGELFQSIMEETKKGVTNQLPPLKSLAEEELRLAVQPPSQPSGGAVDSLRGGAGGFGGGGIAGKRSTRGLKAEFEDNEAIAMRDRLGELDQSKLRFEADFKKPSTAMNRLQLLERQPTRNKFRSLGGRAGFAFDDDSYSLELRKNGKMLYRRLAPTQEWIEQQYYQLPMKNQRPDLVDINRFWKDYSKHTGGSFLSQYFAESHRTLAEMMFALAVLDLPEKAPEHKFEYVDNSMKLAAGGRMVAMHQQFRPVVFKPRNTSILISENFFQKNDRYRQDAGVQYDKFVVDKFFAHTLYGAQVVVTNPTSTPQSIDLLVQIPRGSVAASGSQQTRSMQLQLKAFSTKTFEYFFYFPTAGDFSHYPAHVSREDEVLAVAENVSFNVIDQAQDIDKTSWTYVSQNGTEDDVIEFLRTKNVLSLDLRKIAFRMKDKRFFARTLSTLQSRYRYDHVLWSYGIKHQDKASVGEFLRHENRITNQVGRYFESELLTVHPYERNWYQHREYSPLVNARIHKLGESRKILNPVFRSQYQQLLEILSNRKALSSKDHLVITYYMLLQDRIEEAIYHFGKVDKQQINEEMQFDYCDAYLDFYLENPDSAAEKAAKWVEYPVDLWRNRFKNILAQVEEIRGSKVSVTDSRDNSQQQTKSASQTASFDFKVEASQVKVSAQALEGLQINYYEMDIEHMFSNSPFELKNLDRFSVIEPSATESIKQSGSFDRTFEIPAEFTNRNILVEVRSGDQVKAKPYFANSMSVQTIERYGQILVRTQSAKEPVSKAYVKVYAERNGQIKFHKDGYTDLRGRFDYVTQSNNPLDGVSRYSILVLSPTHGAVTRQAKPPAE